MQTILYLQLNMFTILLCLLLLWHNHRNKHGVMRNKMFHYMLVVVCICVTINSVSWLLEGNPNPQMHMIYFITLELEFVLQILPCFMMLVYTQDNKQKLSGIQKAVRLFPFMLGIIMMLINIWIPFVFRINEGNYYERMTGFFVVGSIPAMYMIWSLINCMVAYMRETDKKRSIYLQYVVLLLFPIVGSVIQIFAYGMETRWMMTTLGFIYIYISLQRNREQRLLQELSEIKVSTMLSQIQYHFVFNTLSTIEMYCVENPKYANEMLECFQKYLRYNLEAINRAGSVHFKEELEHTRQYVALEKMRFGDHLTVQYDIQEDDFFLPILSLQPIVEHAVRYGVCKSEEAGTVLIRTKKAEKNICLSIQDSGRAVDADSLEALMEKQQEHQEQQELAGLVNIKKRIEESGNHGEMTLYSRKSMGTCVTIYIPL